MHTIKTAARKLGVCENTVRCLCGKRLLRHVRVGVGRGRILIPEDAIEEYLQSRTVTPEERTSVPPRKARPALRHLSLS